MLDSICKKLSQTFGRKIPGGMVESDQKDQNEDNGSTSEEELEKEEVHDVIIVGAGWSGLSAGE